MMFPETVIMRLQMWLVLSEVNLYCLGSQSLSLQTSLCTTWQETKHQWMQMDVSME